MCVQYAQNLPVHQETQQQFLVDLKNHIQIRQDKGDMIILGMDNITKCFEELNMKEVI